MQPVAAALTYLAAVNLLTWLAFARDRRAARDGGWRVPEKNLLWLALLGGTPAAKLAQRKLRYKTRKQPFGAILNSAVGLHVVLALSVPALALSPPFRAWVYEHVAQLLSTVAPEPAAQTTSRRFGSGG